jgi:SAM-dependent methyltransferase
VTLEHPPVPSPSGVSDRSFDEYYYRHCCGKPYCRNDEWMAFFGGIAERIVEGIGPTRVLDAGCALGLLVEALRDRGVEAVGVDLSSYAIGQLHDKVKPYCCHGSISDEFSDRYDLIVCIEVLEHMPASAAEAAIANICRHTDDVLFSSTPFDHREPTHVNVHPPEHWAELFARHDFFRDADYDASFVTAWAVRFVRRREPVSRVIRGYERCYWDRDTAARGAHDHAATLQHQVEDLQRHVQDLQNQVTQLTAIVDRARLPEQEAHLRLDEARDRIFHMERSLFWRSRLQWLRIKRLFGSRAE